MNRQMSERREKRIKHEERKIVKREGRMKIIDGSRGRRKKGGMEEETKRNE